MKVIEEIRLENLRRLVLEAGGVTKLADRVKKSQAQISQLVNQSPDSKTKKPKAIGSTQARQFEKAMAKERGWMDHEEMAAAVVSAIRKAVTESGDTKATDDYVEKNLPDFVRPDSPLGLRVRKQSIVRNVTEPGDQLDIFRDRPKRKP